MPDYRHSIAAALVAITLTSAAQAAPRVARPVNERAKSSQHVVVATVTAVDARYETNQYGDRLIVSRIRLAVEEAMKGPLHQALDFDLEGGAVGEISLSVSDLPKLMKGERAVFFLSRSRNNRLVPHLRGQSILKLDGQDRVAGTNVSVNEIREQVRSAQ